MLLNVSHEFVQNVFDGGRFGRTCVEEGDDVYHEIVEFFVGVGVAD